MVDRDVLRSPASAAITVQLAGELGVPPEQCLRGSGLGEDDLRTSEARVSVDQELAVIANLVTAAGDNPGLGLEAGLRYHLTTYGIWGFAMVSSATLREAVSVGLRFLDLTFAYCRITLEEHGDEARILLDPADVPVGVRRFVVDRDAAAIMTIQRELMGLQVPLRRLVVPGCSEGGNAASLQRYVDIFGVGAEEGEGPACAAFDRGLLDLPLPQADPWTTAAAQEQCRALLEARSARSGRAGLVRDAILERLAQGPRVETIAADLHLSPRSLQRTLAAEGTSYRALLEEVRQGMAREMLVDGGLTVAEVARRLGYVELTSFSQAFRRWEGTSPRQFRHVAR